MMIGRTMKVLVAAGAGLGLMAAASAATAACTKPVGKFVGAGSGSLLTTGTGAFNNAIALSLSLNIASDGSVSATQVAKNVSRGVFNLSWTVSKGKNTFSTSTCQGTLTTNLGDKFTYTSSGSGTVMTLIYTKADSVVALYTIRLEKV